MSDITHRPPIDKRNWFDRRWQRRHIRHGTVRVNQHITVPMFSSSRGLLMRCSCGEVRAR